MVLKANHERASAAAKEPSAPAMLDDLPRDLAMEAQLTKAFEAGRAAWPGTKLDADAFAQRASRLEVRADEVAARGADLYLAWACAERDKTALSYFERLFLPAVDGYVGRLGLADAVVDDVRQELRIRL